METIRYSLDEKPYTSPILREYFKGQKVAVLDLETTGLYHRQHKIILAGFLFLEPDKITGVQYFTDNVAEEEGQLLQACLEEIKDIDVLITYNGNRFDLPFLKARAMTWQIPFPLNVFSLDMYRAIRHYSPLGEFLPNLKQKTVENYLGLGCGREDEIDGGESVALYWKYTECKDPELKRLILLHNSDDIYQLSRIIRITEKLDVHRILFNEGFSVKEGDKRVVVQRMGFRKNGLVVEGSTNCPGRCYCGFDTGFRGDHNVNDCRLTIEIPCYTSGDMIYVVKSDFPFSFDALANSPANRGDGLILKDQDQICYREVNFLVREISREILQNL